MAWERHSLLSYLILFGLLACISACTRPNDKDTSRPLVLWKEKFKEEKHIVLMAPWEQAENAYAELNAGVSSTDEMKLWIGFQIEILDETENDPLKDEIRMSAASDLMDYPDIVRPYVQHLEDGLATNRYKEARVRDWVKFAIERVKARDNMKQP